ncbi:MAG: hypothetical protein AB9919_03140 [Geobacteraceae bacterium]
MPKHVPSALSFTMAQPEKGADGSSSHAPINSLRPFTASSIDKSFRAVGRLLTLSCAVSLFLLLPIATSQAEMNLPGNQVPGARIASFDRKESVLDRIRAFSGKKTPAALEGLFTRWDPVFSQNPAVLLSDGTTVARITLRVQGSAGDPPNFSVTGGHFVSAKMTDTGSWILEILPNRASLSTSLTVAFSGQMTEYPLTVAPPLDLFDARTADAATIDYVTTANHLAAPVAVPERK